MKKFLLFMFISSALALVISGSVVLWNVVAYDNIECGFYKIYNPYIDNITESVFVKEYIDNINSLNTKLSEDSSMVRTPKILAFQSKMKKTVDYLRENTDGNKECILRESDKVLTFYMHDLSSAYRPPEISHYAKMIHVFAPLMGIFFISMIAFAIIGENTTD